MLHPAQRVEDVRVARLELPGAAHLELVEGVAYLDQPAAVFASMLAGWSTQQQSRMLAKSTIGPRVKTIQRFADFTGTYPWQWHPGDLEEFTTHLRSGARPIAHSTARTYQTTIGMFGAYLTDPRYAWIRECEQRFGETPMQICHEWNTVEHKLEFEGRPERRAATYAEVQALFDAADDRAEAIRSRRRKGFAAAWRDAAMLKTVYAFGLRRQEACMLDLADLRRNPKIPAWGRTGALEVRHGKASAGSPPKRRAVLLVPEFDWVIDTLQLWLDQVRPRFVPGQHPALWVTERRGRVQPRKVDGNFAEIRDLAGVDAHLDLHSLRHSYVTHLLEFGYPELFVQQQVGHAYASTTAIYSSVSDAYRNRLLVASIDRQLAHLRPQEHP